MKFSRQELASLPCLHEGSNFLIYRLDKSDYERPVIIKLLKHDYPTPRQNTRLANEYELTKDLDICGMRKAREKITVDGQPALILDYVEGEPVKQAIIDQRWDLVEMLAAAGSMAQALGELHSHNIIHKNINSLNILVDPETLQATLIDFELASPAYLKNRQPDDLEVLQDTLAYISPEQTGRTGRFVDYRTDFYSLGVVLYEMMTGKLPFDTADPAELVYYHLAKHPRPVAEVNPEIPPVVSDMVAKLLAKNPESRYQSTYGLKADLDKALAQLRKTGAIENFELAQEDFSGRLQFPQKLYGREAASQALKEAFEYVGKGAREVVLITGNPGVGKSALAEEMRQRVAQKGGYFIAGKYDQYQRNIPYYGLIPAFNSLVSQMLTQSAERLADQKAKILKAVGDSGQLLIEVIPNLELIIGRQPAVPDLSPTEAQYRFHRVFQNFVGAITQKEHPLVIFLDNLQWVDAASPNLLKLLLTNAAHQYLLLVGAYREDEVTVSHPLMIALEEMKQEKVVINEFHLEALSLDTLNLLIADTLQCEAAYALPLTHLVYEKVDGNPFFAVEFLSSLLQEGVLAFDFEARQWKWAEDQIREKNIPANMAALMTGKIEKLPEDARQVLALAACIGNSFDLKTLAVISGLTVNTIFENLQVGVKQGFILPPDNYEILLGLEAPQKLEMEGSFEFLDERIRQALYPLIGKKQRRLVNLTIGRLRLESVREGELEESIFDIADRFNEGFQHITDEQEILKLAELNLIAGRKAKKATAYKTAVWYLSMGIGMLPPKHKWSFHYDLTLNLYAEAVEAEYLNSTFERAEQLAQEALEYATDILEKIRFYQLLILLYTAQNRNSAAIEAGWETLDLLDVSLPTEAGQISAYVEKVRQELADKVAPVEELAKLPEMRDPYQLAAMRVLVNMTAPVHQARPELLPVVASTLVMMSVRYGNSPFSAFAYGWYAVLLGAFYGDFEQGYRFGQLSMMLVEQFGAAELKVKVSFLFNALVRPWREHVRETLEPLQQVYQTGLETGDLEYAYYGALHGCSYRFCAGSNLEQIRQQQFKYLDTTEKFRLEFHSNFGKIWTQTVLNLLGQTADPCQLKGELFNEAESLPLWIEQKNMILTFSVFCCRAMLQYLFKNYAGAIEAAEWAEQYGQGGVGFFYLPLHHFIYALALLAHYPEVEAETKQAYLDKVASIQEKMKVWAGHAPMNFQHKFDLIEAERARVAGETAKAAEFFGRAIRGAREQGYIQEEALAYEREGEFYLALGREDLAQFCLTRAGDGYRSWGAARKVEDLEQRYKHLLIVAKPRPGLKETQEPTSPAAGHASTSLDMAAILKVSHTLAEEVRLEKLLDKVIHIVMENAGAEKGILIEHKDSSLLIQAKGEIGRDVIETMQAMPMEDSGEVPISIVNYVARTQMPVVLNDAAHDSIYASDPYIAAFSPKSLLCLPIVHKNNLFGLLYLENNLTTNTFTQDRLELLRVVMAQAAISMENAALYISLEEKINQLARLTRIMETTSDIVSMATPAAQVIYMNRAGRKLVGWGDDESLAGKMIPQLHPEGVLRIIEREGIPTAIEKGGWQGETVIFNSEGSEIPVSQVIMSHKSPTGELEYISTIMRDISERKRAEQEREQMQQQIIEAQQMALHELSAPVIPVMSHIIVMPLIGSIDSLRARDVTRALLAGISEYKAKIAILDITGVPIVDSGVANHINKTIQAARLKGTHTIITGISEAVAQTIVDLGIDWNQIRTLPDLQTGLLVALRSMGIKLVKA